MVSRRTLVASLGAVALLVSLASCGRDAGTPAGGPAVATDEACPAGALPTEVPGKITFGTDSPAYEPWFVGNEPANGQGYESALAYQLAKRLGYPASAVVWTRVPTYEAVAPGPKAFDLVVDQVLVTPERKRAVDFSGEYYLVRQAVVARRGSAVASATTLADLRHSELGAVTGSTGLTAIGELIRPAVPGRAFDSEADGRAALRSGAVDGLVVPLPTAFAMARERLDTVVAGQLPRVGVPDRFGMVLEKDSPLRHCVGKAIDQLRQDGTFAVLEKTWIAGTRGAPELG